MTNENEDPASETSDELSEAYQASESPASSHPNLRWWPALLLLVTMVVIRFIPSMVETPSMPLMLLAFLGPAGLGVALMVWFCFASRATVREKVIGTVAVILISAISIILLHDSLKGMFAVVLVVPTGLAAFAIALILGSRSLHKRLPIALLVTIAAFGYWDLRQSEGTTGDFKSQLLWRWKPTAEQRYLSELAERQSDNGPIVDSTPVTLESAQWPDFRGRDRDGVIRGITLASDWDATPPRQIWKQKIGPGWSSFSVAGDRLFTQEQRGEEEAVVCLDANTGNQIWEFTYPSRFWEAIAGAGPRATPTIADEGIFALGADGILVRLDATSGAEIWRRDLKQDADRKPPTWGFASSPLVTESLVIVHAGGSDDKGTLAYDVESGEIAWSVPAGNHSYSSAQLATFAGQPGVLMLSNDGLSFLNIADGQTIWNHEWKSDNYRTLQPLVVGPSVYFMTGLQEGTRRLNVSHQEDGTWSVTEDWTTRNMKSDYNDMVYHDGNLYGFDGGVFACVDADTGDRRWKRGRYGNGQVVLLADSSQLLVVTEKGEIAIVDASPDKFTEIAKYQVIDGKTWNHPVLIGDRLFVRNAQEAACYQLAIEEN